MISQFACMWKWALSIYSLTPSPPLFPSKVCFLADLVNSKVVASSSIMNVFDTFATVTYEPNIPQVGADSSVSFPFWWYFNADSVWLVCVHGPLGYTLGMSKLISFVMTLYLYLVILVCRWDKNSRRERRLNWKDCSWPLTTTWRNACVHNYSKYLLLMACILCTIQQATFNLSPGIPSVDVEHPLSPERCKWVKVKN